MLSKSPLNPFLRSSNGICDDATFRNGLDDVLE
jgi:hypothetical protein